MNYLYTMLVTKKFVEGSYFPESTQFHKLNASIVQGGGEACWDSSSPQKL